MNDILVALITGGLALIGVIIANRRTTAELLAKLDKQSELSDARLEKAQAVTDAKLEELTREVRKHNSFAERVPILEEKAKATDRRLTDLEHKSGSAQGGN